MDENGEPSAVEIVWMANNDRDNGETMAEWCRTVGPALYAEPVRPVTSLSQPIDRLWVISWNMHVGSGDLAAVVAALSSGRLTDGEPVADLVLLFRKPIGPVRRFPMHYPPVCEYPVGSLSRRPVAFGKTSAPWPRASVCLCTTCRR